MYYLALRQDDFGVPFPTRNASLDQIAHIVFDAHYHHINNNTTV